MKRILKNTEGGARGFTLIEMLVAIGLFGLVIGALTRMSDSSQRAYTHGTVSAHLESQIARTMGQVSEELRRAGAGSIAFPAAPGVPAEVAFLQALDFENGQVTWSDGCRLLLEYELGEVGDGIDNNGNELVDEGRLVLVTDEGEPTERRRTLTRWVAGMLEGELPNNLDDNGNGLVDERGFALEQQGRTLIVHLTLQRNDRERRPIVRTGTTSVRLRN